MNTPQSAGDLDTAFLAGGGELGELVRNTDWSETALGDPRQWPRSLKTVVRIMLTSSQPIWIGWGPQLLYLYNDPYKSIIGGKHPWALGRPTSVVWHEVWTDIGPLLATAMNGDGTFVESQLLIMERNGYPEETYYTFSYSPIPGDDGRPAGIICANSDETRRVVGERQLAMLRDVAASTAEAKGVEEAVRRCTEAMQANQRDVTFALAFLRRHGQKTLELYGKSGGCTTDQDESGALDPLEQTWHAAQVLAQGEHKLVELPRDRDWPGGAWNVPSAKAMVLPLMPVSDAGHEGVLVVGLNPFRLPDQAYLDFLKLLAQQVESAVASAEAFEAERLRAEQLAELDRAKTLFFSNVSHEFRTPLTLMRGPIADVIGDPELPMRLRERLALVERNAVRMSKLVSALLEFSRIEAGRLRSVFRPTDLSRLTAELASNFRSAVERAGLAYEVDCPPLQEPVYVDHDQWERIVLNLLSNALKFTLSGSISLRLRAQGHEVVLEVQDTGVGVPEHEIGRLFERFYRVEGTHGRTHEGSGIGLALVQEFVRLHGGSVCVDSRLGTGTTFAVRMPLGKGHLPADRVGAAVEPPEPADLAEAFVQEALHWLPDADVADDGAQAAGEAPVGERYRSTLGARVVVADDNADLRLYLTRLLEPYYEVEAARDGQEALDAVRRKRPALLISDVMMPRLDGFGLLEALRKDRELVGVPVILLSARAGEEARIEGLRSGADDYLVKPFTARELLARVSGIIELDRVRRSSEEQLNIFLAGAQMFTWDLDLVSERIAMSANAADVLGVAPANLREAYACVHPDDEARHRQVVDGAVRSAGQFADEIRVIRPNDGQARWLLVRGRCTCDEQARPVRLSGLAFDITERKGMEMALRESDRRKDEFLAMLAHELRNPMAPIRNAVDLLVRVQSPNETASRALEIINRQLRQLTRLVDDLLDVSRITTGRIQIEKRPLDLSIIVGAALEACEAIIRERSQDISVVSGLPMNVLGDAPRLQQCVVNLLTNAAKYTEPGGHIRVALQRDREEAVICVEDTGVGIAPEFLPYVFDLFVQSDRTLDRAEGGLGIGLSVVKRLVEMHGGTVSASSPGLGKGSTFEIRLPLAQLRADPDNAGIEAREVQPLRVIVVDDNRDAADSLALALQAAGHQMRAAYAANEAVKLAREWQPHAMLLDIGLPDMNGYVLAQQLRRDTILQSTYLIALSGYGQPADKARSRAAGFNDHLVKPADITQVLAALDEVASRMLLGSVGRARSNAPT
jgi:signal transduction histidine kinase